MATKAKRKFRYKVVVKGITISYHYTKKAAISASSKVRGYSSVKSLTTTYKKRYNSRKRRY